MFQVVLIVVLAALILFLIRVALKSPDSTITRQAVIDAPGSVVFELVNNLRKWNSWSPWAKKDPNMEKKFEGPERGTGAIHSWVGNSQVGEGRMTIVESNPDELIRFKLEFFKPFNCTNSAVFQFKPDGNKTHIVWSMSGKQSFVSRLFCTLFNMDKAVGRDFEQGLSQIKAIAESNARTEPPSNQDKFQ